MERSALPGTRLFADTSPSGSNRHLRRHAATEGRGGMRRLEGSPAGKPGEVRPKQDLAAGSNDASNRITPPPALHPGHAQRQDPHQMRHEKRAGEAGGKALFAGPQGRGAPLPCCLSRCRGEAGRSRPSRTRGTRAASARPRDRAEHRPACRFAGCPRARAPDRRSALPDRSSCRPGTGRGRRRDDGAGCRIGRPLSIVVLVMFPSQPGAGKSPS